MKIRPVSQAVAAALLVCIAVAGCKKDEPAPSVTTPAPAPTTVPMTPDPMQQPATATITSVNLGTSVGADGSVTSPASTFATNEAITASVSTATSNPAAAVPGTLTARWTYQDGQVVNEESREFSLAGPGVTNFRISNAAGWPPGQYTLEVLLDDRVVETVDFSVQ